MCGKNVIAVNKYLGQQWNHASIEFIKFKYLVGATDFKTETALFQKEIRN